MAEKYNISVPSDGGSNIFLDRFDDIRSMLPHYPTIFDFSHAYTVPPGSYSVIMKVSLAPSIGCTLLLIIGRLRVVGAAKDRISVPSGDGFNFFLDRFDDGRTKPYLVTFTSSGFKSVYKFTEGGFVTNIKAGDETYTIGYDDNDEIETVERTSAQRKLVVDQEYEEDGEDIQTYQQPPSREGGEDIQTYQQTLFSAQTRRLFACEDCELAWQTVCNAGVESVCNLEDFGEPVLSAGETSIGVLCNTFGGICSQRTASEVCDGSCDEVDCLSPLTITLEWTGGSGLSARQEPKLDLYVIEPGGRTTMNRYSGQVKFELALRPG